MDDVQIAICGEWRVEGNPMDNIFVTFAENQSRARASSVANSSTNHGGFIYIAPHASITYIPTSSSSLLKMSCNGCRALRKGCSQECMLRHSLDWIQHDPQAQAHATLFVATFFGRATLMSSLSSVPINQRSDMFRSLMYEAVGRTVNPVHGAVGLLWTGNWHLCQLGVQKVLQGLNVPTCQQPPSHKSDTTISQHSLSQTKNLLTLFL